MSPASNLPLTGYEIPVLMPTQPSLPPQPLQEPEEDSKNCFNLLNLSIPQYTFDQYVQGDADCKSLKMADSPQNGIFELKTL